MKLIYRLEGSEYMAPELADLAGRLAQKLNTGIKGLDIPGAEQLRVGVGAARPQEPSKNPHEREGLGKPAYLTYRLCNDSGEEVREPGRALLYAAGDKAAAQLRQPASSASREYHGDRSTVARELASAILQAISFAGI